jgi:hypothetical protein
MNSLLDLSPKKVSEAISFGLRVCSNVSLSNLVLLLSFLLTKDWTDPQFSLLSKKQQGILLPTRGLN